MKKSYPIMAVLAFLLTCLISAYQQSPKAENMDSLIARLSHWTDLKTVKPTLDSSPTMERLKNAGQDEIRRFWDAISNQGAPMVEPCGEDDRLIMTFLYRSSHKNLKVHIDIKNVRLGNGGSDMMLLSLENTDIWYRTFRIPADWSTAYRYSITDDSGTVHQTDKFNRNLIPIGVNADYSYNAFDPSLDEANARFYEKPGVPKGVLKEYAVESKILGNSRSVVVYRPFGYDEGKEYPSIFVFDQSLYLERVPLPTILDNLIAERRIPPCVAILVDNQPTERREKELPLYKPFADFVALELMPWAFQTIRIAKDPDRTIIAGVSYGGLASSFIALSYPDLFGNVLSQSGSYWRGIQVNDPVPWLTEQYKKTKRLPIRFYLDCGLQETAMRSFSNFNFIEKHRQMRDVLKSKGYELYYQEFQSGHDWTGWRKTLPDGLIVLFDRMKKENGRRAVR